MSATLTADELLKGSKKVSDIQPEQSFISRRMESLKEVNWTQVAVKTFWFSLAAFWAVEAVSVFMLMQWASLFGLVYLGICAGCVVFGLAA
jgi:hypothetical protein